MALHPRARRILALASLILPTTGFGATIDKANNAIDLDQPGSWVGGVLPTNADITRWNSTVTGPNTVAIAGIWNYAGITIADPGGLVTINGAGTLQLGSAGLDMSAATQDLVIDNATFRTTVNQSWNIAAGRTVTWNSSTTSGQGVITQSGGTVILRGTGNPGNHRFIVDGTAANPGLLTLDRQNATALTGFAADVVTVNPFGTLRLAGTGGNQINDASGVALNGGIFDLNGSSEKIFRLSGASGTVTNTSTTASVLTLAAPSNPSTDVTFGGTLEDGNGTLSLIKQQTNIFTLSGENTYSGSTDVTGGTLVVTGSIAESAVSVASGATLAGGGIVGSLTVASGATVSPGVGSTADLEIDGALTFQGGTLTLELNGSTVGSYDQLVTTGSISLTSDVALNLSLGFTPGFTSFTIVNNQSVLPISGSGLFSFGGNPLSEGEHFDFNGYDAVITYAGGTGNDVVISVPEPGSAALLLLGSLGFIRRRRNS